MLWLRMADVSNRLYIVKILKKLLKILLKIWQHFLVWGYRAIYLVFKFGQTTNSHNLNWRDSNSPTQGLNSAQTQIRTLLQMSTYFCFNLNANNSIYIYITDKLLTPQKAKDIQIFHITQICAVFKFAHPLLSEFQYCANFNTIKVY